MANATWMTWQQAIDAYDRGLGGRGAAQRTRRAYRLDLDQFAEWARRHDLDGPASIRHRDVRRFAARLSESGASAATVARKLAAVRSFYASLVRHRSLSQNPADLVGSPKRPSKLPRVLAPEQIAALLERIPAR